MSEPSNLVAELERFCHWARMGGHHPGPTPENLLKVADEIERLTAELANAKAACVKAHEFHGEKNSALVAERDRLQQECARIASENACRMISERRLRAALEWYANPPDDEVIELYTKEDYESLTRRAREALAGGKHD